MRLRRDVRDTAERNDRPDTIAPLLFELATARLQARHGFNVHDADTEAARRLLPPDLHSYLLAAGSGTARRSKRELEPVGTVGSPVPPRLPYCLRARGNYPSSRSVAFTSSGDGMPCGRAC